MSVCERERERKKKRERERERERERYREGGIGEWKKNRRKGNKGGQRKSSKIKVRK